MESSEKILIVDDNPKILQFMEYILREAGYPVECASSGEEALRRMEDQLPALIILDVEMGGISGFEVCRRLKADSRTAVVPVIITTALEDRKDRLQGIAAGASDYLNKPVDVDDLLIRVRNALRNKSFYDELRENYKHLKGLESLKEHLLHFIVHDIRTPLQGILAYLEFLEEGLRSEEEKEYLWLTQQNAKMISRMLEDLLAVYQMESQKLPLHRAWTTLGEIWTEARDTLKGLAEQRRIRLETLMGLRDFPLYVDRDLIRRVLLNLMSNALKYAPAGSGIFLKAKMENENSSIRIEIQDQGPGISPENQMKLFEKFGIVETVRTRERRSIGLGLTFCKLAIEAHGGKIGVTSALSEGATFWFTLPSEHGR